MADEPTLGELQRLIERIDRHLQDLASKIVQVEVYNTEQRAWERRFSEVERDLAEEKQARREAVKALQERLDRSGTNWRQAVYSGLIPAVFFIVTIAVTVSLALRGGK